MVKPPWRQGTGRREGRSPSEPDPAESAMRCFELLGAHEPQRTRRGATLGFQCVVVAARQSSGSSSRWSSLATSTAAVALRPASIEVDGIDIVTLYSVALARTVRLLRFAFELDPPDGVPEDGGDHVRSSLPSPGGS